MPLGLLAIAVGGILAAWTERRPPAAVTTPLLPAAPPASQAWENGIARLLRRQVKPRVPLTVPPPVLPQTQSPSQAWPELPLVQSPPEFTDIGPEHWAWPLLSDLAQRNLVAGFPDGAYRPADPMTRAELAAQLVRLFDFPEDPTQSPKDVGYSDLSTDHWAYNSVQKSVQLGFLTGYPEGVFLPDQTVTRIHVIVALANGLMLKSSRGPAPLMALYSDQSQVPPWAIRHLVAATEAGLVVNYPDLSQLAPNKPASRAEVAAMLHRALVYTGYLQDVPFPYVAGHPAVNP